MAESLKLVGYKYSTSVQRILAAARFANAPIVMENLNREDKARNELRKNSQTGTFPYLATSNGVLSESFAIIQYLAKNYNKALLGNDAWEEALVNQWVQFSHLEIESHRKYTIYPLFGFHEYIPAEADKALTEIMASLKYLNEHLEDKDCIVGTAYTLADLEQFYELRPYFQFVFTEGMRENFKNVTRWFVKLAEHENISSCYGRTLLAKVAQLPPRLEKSLKLVGYKYSQTVQRVISAAKFAGAPVVLENIHWNNSAREHLKLHSETQTFPYIETNHGTISESFAIIKFLANSYNKSLFGHNEFEKAQINSWVEFAHHEISRHAKYILYPIFGFYEYHKEEADNALKELMEWLRTLNKHLKGKHFMVGGQYTIADIELFYALRGYFQLVFSEDIRRKIIPNITAWFIKLASHPHMIESYGRTLLCKVPQKPPINMIKKESFKKKEEHIKKHEPKKSDKHILLGENADKESKKKSNPLDLLPPPALVLDEFKREFLNAKDKSAILSKFWTKYSPQDYSLWWMRYDKLPSEGKILFRTKNSMSFFLQKLDSLRKHAFAAHGIYGVEGDYDIRGVWMWRGTEIPEEFKQHESYEHMKLRKLDAAKEEDRKLVEKFWLTTKPGEIVDGLPVAYAETFK